MDFDARFRSKPLDGLTREEAIEALKQIAGIQRPMIQSAPQFGIDYRPICSQISGDTGQPGYQSDLLIVTASVPGY